MDLLPHEGHRSLVLRDDGAERVHHRRAALEHRGQHRLERLLERPRVEELLVVPCALALAPPVGLVVTEHERDDVVEQHEAALVVREVVRRPEDDLPASLLERLLVEPYQREILGQLRGVHDPETTRSAGSETRRPEDLGDVGEALREPAIRIHGARAGGQRTEHDGLGLAGGRVAIQLGDLEPVVGDEDVGARDHVPQRLRREPYRLLIGRQSEERIQHLRLVGHHEAQLVVDLGHLLRDAVHGARLGGAHDHGLFAEPWLSEDPRVGDDAARRDAPRECVVGGGRAAARPLLRHHSSRATDSAVAR